MVLGVEMAPRPGFEPGLEDSKSSVLPLDDLGTMRGPRESAATDSRIYRAGFDIQKSRDYNKGEILLRASVGR